VFQGALSLLSQTAEDYTVLFIDVRLYIGSLHRDWLQIWWWLSVCKILSHMWLSW